MIRGAPNWQLRGLWRRMQRNSRTTITLKIISETDLARFYEDQKGNRQWVPRSQCQSDPPGLGVFHEVSIASWWLKENPFEKPDGKGTGEFNF